jgi:Peptidase A4 family
MHLGKLISRGTVALCVAAPLLVAVPPALADVGNSSNWAGFAVHRPGISFERVYGAWTQPHARCRRGRRSYSAMWVGLGGFSPTAQGLEQIGTELDCKASGKVASSAWLELIPAASQNIHLRVQPGDSIAAAVTVIGHQVTVGLLNLTRHTSFQRTVFGPSIDVSSAEWILEAPSECTNANSCQTLPLANFGRATFVGARAEITDGHSGPITDPAWDSSKIRLRPGGRRFVANHGSRRGGGAATPSRLNPGGSSFSVSFSQVSPRSPFFSFEQPLPRGAYEVH